MQKKIPMRQCLGCREMKPVSYTHLDVYKRQLELDGLDDESDDDSFPGFSGDELDMEEE